MNCLQKFHSISTNQVAFSRQKMWSPTDDSKPSGKDAYYTCMLVYMCIYIYTHINIMVLYIHTQNIYIYIQSYIIIIIMMIIIVIITIIITINNNSNNNGVLSQRKCHATAPTY